jgi:hypothetical protein
MASIADFEKEESGAGLDGYIVAVDVSTFIGSLHLCTCIGKGVDYDLKKGKP